jgi:hypothetical protein
MTSNKSKFSSVIAAVLLLIIYCAIIAWIYSDLSHVIKHGTHAQMQHRLVFLTVLMLLPGLLVAFLLGFPVRLVTNPSTRWILPSVLVGAGAGIALRSVANKIQTEQARRPTLAPPPKANRLEAPAGATPLDGRGQPEPVAELPGTQAAEGWYKGPSLTEHGKKTWSSIKRLKDAVPTAYRAAGNALGSKNSDERGFIAPDSAQQEFDERSTESK